MSPRNGFLVSPGPLTKEYHVDDKNLVPDLASRMPKDDREAAASLLRVLSDPELGLKLELSEDQRDQALHAITPFLVAFAMNRHHGWITERDPTRDLPYTTPGDGWHQPEHHRHGHAPRWKNYGERPVFIAAPTRRGKTTFWFRRCCGQAMRRAELIACRTCTVCCIREWYATGVHYAGCDRCGKRECIS